MEGICEIQMATNHPPRLIYLNTTKFLLLGVFSYIHFLIETIA